MKKLFIPLFLILVICNIHLFGSANSSAYDTSRIYNVLAKARAGDTVNIVMIGGSITAGSLASSVDNRYTNLVTTWWKTTFPDATINLINSGIGGTGSDVGTFRIQDDVLKYDPDFVLIEFAVNDAGKNSQYVQKMLEGIVRQLLKTETAIMFLMLKMEDGSNAQTDHKIIGNAYKIPMISFVDLIGPALTKDGKTLRDIYGDNPGVHPNDLGMQYTANFIIDELKINYNNLPNDENIPAINTDLQAPLVTNTFENTYKYNQKTLVPSVNTGWTLSNSGWTGDTPGEEMTFEIDGNAIAIQYTRHNTTERGRVEIWLDDLPHSTLDAYWTETWGPATVFQLMAENLTDTIHTLHIKVLGTTSATGNTFYLLNVMKAGNIKGVAPVANGGYNTKILIGSSVDLDGSSSFDPDGPDSSLVYSWSVFSGPEGSSAIIPNSGDSVTKFQPDVAGNYIIQLIVSDTVYNSVPFKKRITVKAENAKPVAATGTDRKVPTKKDCFLSGLSSYDADGDSITYSWSIISQPAGSAIILNKATTYQPKFNPRVEGEYKFSLVVNDSIENSLPDTIIITAITGYSSVEEFYHPSSIKISPNPVKDQLNLSLKEMEAGKKEISILTLNGNVIYSENIQVKGNYSKTIDVSRLNKGTYLLRLINNGKVEVTKFTRE